MDKIQGISAARSLAFAEAHVFERHSLADERILLREALIAVRGDITLGQLRSALAARLQSGELTQTGRIITSREMLALEKSIVACAADGKGTLPRMGTFSPQDSLSPEQNRAAEKILASHDRAVVLVGDAGAGKSTTLPVIVRVSMTLEILPYRHSEL